MKHSMPEEPSSLNPAPRPGVPVEAPDYDNGGPDTSASGPSSAALRRAAVLRWTGALVAGVLIVVPLWILTSNQAVPSGHPALPALLLAAIAAGLLWAFTLVRRSTTAGRRWFSRHNSTEGNQPKSRGATRWQLVRGLAGRLAAVGLIAGLAWLEPFPATAPAAAPATSGPATRAVTVQEDATSISLVPDGKATAGLVFYPGARVDAHAYQHVLGPVAAAGNVVVILKEPLGISLLDSGQAREAMDRHPEVPVWAVGGHSLGGVSASSFAKANPDVAGLVLFASYPAESMADARDLSVLSISGSKDGLSTPDKIAASKSLLPPTTTFATVEGGIHAFFGDYGDRPGDGEPGTTREQAQQEIAAETVRFMEQLGTAG